LRLFAGDKYSAPEFANDLPISWANGMTYRFIIVTSMLVLCSACDDSSTDNRKVVGSSSEQREADMEVDVANASRRYEAEYRHLTVRGQGCAGRILFGEELRKSISGKWDRTREAPHFGGTVYQSDGRLRVRYQDPGGRERPEYGRYTVDGPFLCRTGDRLPSEKHCNRMIVNTRGSLVMEAMNQNGSNRTLTCLPVILETWRQDVVR
jgi:hypothetical protein